MSTGNLIVQTRAANDAIPVVDATITVYATDSDGIPRPVITKKTDISGSTPMMELSTPSLNNTTSQEIPPFAVYRIDIDHPDYLPVTVLDVAVFSDITTTLPITMTPPHSQDGKQKRIIIDSTELGPTGSGVE